MIDYNNIADSIEYYEIYNFKRIETPWLVTKEISAITKPVNCVDYTVLEKDKVLVASGEQSFLYLYNKGYLPKGKFQTVTPCFRNDSYDEIHSKCFIKNELIVTDNVTVKDLQTVVALAKIFFKNHVPDENKLSVITTNVPDSEVSCDIMYDDIELGSYGIRHCSFLSWIYGTGCAEPRLSFCQNINSNNNI